MGMYSVQVLLVAGCRLRQYSFPAHAIFQCIPYRMINVVFNICKATHKYTL